MAVTSCGSYAATSAAADFSLPLNVLGLPSLANTIGAVYVGVVIGTMLFGLTLHQTYRYFQLYPSDGMRIKIFVIVIVVLEAFHSILWTIAGYHYLIIEFFNFPGVLVGHWSVKMLVTETTFLVVACGSFYTNRVYVIGPQYKWLVIPAVVSMLAAVGFGIAAGIEAFTSTRYITDFSRISWLVSAAYGLAALTDVILTGSLVYVLRKYRTESKRSDSVLYILTVYAINTGLLTSIISIAAFIFAIILPGNMIYAAFSVVGAKLCANSVLAVLNSRRSIDDRFLVDDFSACTVEPGASESPRDGGHQARRRDVESLVFAHPQISCTDSKVVSVQLEEIQFAIEGNAEDDGLNGIGEDLSPKGLATASGSIQNYDVETKPLETSP